MQAEDFDQPFQSSVLITLGLAARKVVASCPL